MHRMIAVCDGCEDRRRLLARLLQNYDDAPLLFSGAAELLTALRRGARPMVAFLRSDEDPALLRSCALALDNCPCTLVLTSDSAAGALLGFSLGAEDFLVSPVTAGALGACMVRLLRRQPCRFRRLGDGSRLPQLWLRDILFIESLDHNCLIRQADGDTIPVRESLSHLEEETDGCGFLRCHRSFLVNCGFVESLVQGALRLRGNLLVPVSRSLIPQVEEICRLQLLRRQFRQGAPL